MNTITIRIRITIMDKEGGDGKTRRQCRTADNVTWWCVPTTSSIAQTCSSPHVKWAALHCILNTLKSKMARGASIDRQVLPPASLHRPPPPLLPSACRSGEMLSAYMILFRKVLHSALVWILGLINFLLSWTSFIFSRILKICHSQSYSTLTTDITTLFRVLRVLST